jgi:hypothetical protein
MRHATFCRCHAPTGEKTPKFTGTLVSVTIQNNTKQNNTRCFWGLTAPYYTANLMFQNVAWASSQMNIVFFSVLTATQRCVQLWRRHHPSSGQQHHDQHARGQSCVRLREAGGWGGGGWGGGGAHVPCPTPHPRIRGALPPHHSLRHPAHGFRWRHAQTQVRFHLCFSSVDNNLVILSFLLWKKYVFFFFFFFFVEWTWSVTLDTFYLVKPPIQND